MNWIEETMMSASFAVFLLVLLFLGIVIYESFNPVPLPLTGQFGQPSLEIQP